MYNQFRVQTGILGSMPELPELEVVCEVLQRRVVGHTLDAVKLIQPGAAIVVRDLTASRFDVALTGATIEAVARRGKFVIFSLTQPHTSVYLAINPKLTGRLQLAAPSDKKTAQDAFDLLAVGRHRSALRRSEDDGPVVPHG